MSDFAQRFGSSDRTNNLSRCTRASTPPREKKCSSIGTQERARAGAVLYRYLIRPLLYRLSAETAHHLIITLLKLAQWFPGGLFLLRLLMGGGPRHPVQALGLTFPSAIGLAAGFDKDAQVFPALAALGFGFVEVGTVTAEAQPGNPRPRLFRLTGDRALINRMGFNNQGAEAAARRLAKTKRPAHMVLGINIGKTKVVPAEEAVADYRKSTELLGPYADYFVVNVSSPNTPGLRDLQAVDSLRPILLGVRASLDKVCPTRRVPLLVKIAPDLNDQDIIAVARLAIEVDLDGMIATNTTISREGLSTSAQQVEALGAGGLSGAPLKARSLAVLQLIRQTVGPELTLISAGGVETPEEAQQRLDAGAQLVQVYSAMVYEGPSLPGRLARGVASS